MPPTVAEAPKVEAANRARVGDITQVRTREGWLFFAVLLDLYGSNKYTDQLSRSGMRRSMSRPGKCGDNAVAESFFRTIKTESLYHMDFETREQARLEIFNYIEGFYNRKRMHSTIDYQSPEEYERLGAA